MSKMDYRYFIHIEKSSELAEYFAGREYRHGKYCHYTNLRAIDNILGEKKFWISNVAGLNDTNDEDQFGAEKRFFFTLCFSTGDNENLPLWYLYSGIDGKGGRFCFTKEQIKNLINEASYHLFEFDELNSKLIGIGHKLVDGKNMKITFKDILYENIDGGSVSLKYNTMTNYRLSKDEYTKFRDQNIGFLKGLIWYYEKETRLLIELIGDARELISPDKKYKIVMDIPESVSSKMNIDLAPEIESQKDIITDYENLYNFMIDSSKIHLSKYKGSVKMKMVNVNKVKEMLHCLNTSEISVIRKEIDLLQSKND